MHLPIPTLRLPHVLLCLAALTPAVRGQVNLASQMPASTENEHREGLIGQTYAFLDLSYVDQRSGSGYTFGPTLGTNLAVGDNADITANLSYARQRQWPDNGSAYQFGLDTTVYLRIHRVKPFLTGGVGYLRSRASSGSDVTTWEAGAGLEVLAASRTAITLKALAVGSLQPSINSVWQYSVGVNRWLSANTAVAATVTYIRDGAVGYTLGLRRAF